MTDRLTFNADLCRALGLDPEAVSRVELYADAKDAPRAVVFMYPTPEQLERILELVRGASADVLRRSARTIRPAVEIAQRALHDRVRNDGR